MKAKVNIRAGDLLTDDDGLRPVTVDEMIMREGEPLPVDYTVPIVGYAAQDTEKGEEVTLFKGF